MPRSIQGNRQQLAGACRDLESIAVVNRDSVDICLEFHSEMPDVASAVMCSEATAHAVAQLFLLLGPLQLEALEMEGCS